MEFQDKIMLAGWMGWQIKKDIHPDPQYIHATYYIKNKKKYLLSDWNPQDDKCPHSVWEEIWDNMEAVVLSIYKKELENIWRNLNGFSVPSREWFIHTISNEIKSKALVKAVR